MGQAHSSGFDWLHPRGQLICDKSTPQLSRIEVLASTSSLEVLVPTSNSLTSKCSCPRPASCPRPTLSPRSARVHDQPRAHVQLSPRSARVHASTLSPRSACVHDQPRAHVQLSHLVSTSSLKVLAPTPKIACARI